MMDKDWVGDKQSVMATLNASNMFNNNYQMI